MSYHKFSNVRESFQGDLNKKIMKGVISSDLINRDCNCDKRTTRNGACVYNGKCRSLCVIYIASDKANTGKHCIGSTQNFIEERYKGHYQDVRKRVKEDEKSSSFANHFASCFPKGENIKSGQVRDLIVVDVLWQGNIINCMKTFGARRCSLCMREKCFILDSHKKDKHKLINHRSEIFGGCRHQPLFHRFRLTTNNAPCWRECRAEAWVSLYRLTDTYRCSHFSFIA